MKNLIFAFFCLLIVPLANADILNVYPDGSGLYPTIQAAIDSASNGDTIIVQPGQYCADEEIYFHGKNITITSTMPLNPDIVSNTIIGCDYPNEVMIFFDGTEEPNCLLTGFNINGAVLGYELSEDPEPFEPQHTHATISNCLFQKDCGACRRIISSVDGTISNCLIADIDCSGAICAAVVTWPISRCHGLIRNCTIANTYTAVEVGWNETTTIENCIFYNSFPSPALIQLHPGSTVNIHYSCIRNGLDAIASYDPDTTTINWGPGNIDTDPCFVALGYWDSNGVLVEGNYHLLLSSPCIDTGDPNYIPGPNETDLDGNPRILDGRIDMGAYEFAPPIEAQMVFTPQSLNCKSKGNWVKAHITLPQDFTPDDVDTDTPAIAEPLGVESEYIKASGGDSSTHVEIAFSREDFCAALTNDDLDNGTLEVTVTGHLTSGQLFYASDSIKLNKR